MQVSSVDRPPGDGVSQQGHVFLESTIRAAPNRRCDAIDCQPADRVDDENSPRGQPRQSAPAAEPRELEADSLALRKTRCTTVLDTCAAYVDRTGPRLDPNLKAFL